MRLRTLQDVSATIILLAGAGGAAGVRADEPQNEVDRRGNAGQAGEVARAEPANPPPDALPEQLWEDFGFPDPDRPWGSGRNLDPNRLRSRYRRTYDCQRRYYYDDSETCSIPVLHRCPCTGHNRAMGGPWRSPAEKASLPETSSARRGAITFICGCMFSEKTTELLRRLSHYSPGQTGVFKHVIDCRYRPDAIVSHAGKALPAIAIAAAPELLGHLSVGIEVVAIDEGHFFDLSLISVTCELAARGIDVVITSLDRDSWGRPFPLADKLRALADEPITKTATCSRCGAVADRTQRLTPIVDDNLVGGPESYQPRCRKCWAPPPEDPPRNALGVGQLKAPGP